MYLKNKTCQLNIRFTERDMELIKRVAAQNNLSVTAFIHSILIPYCCKFDKSKEN